MTTAPDAATVDLLRARTFLGPAAGHYANPGASAWLGNDPSGLVCLARRRSTASQSIYRMPRPPTSRLQSGQVNLHSTMCVLHSLEVDSICLEQSSAFVTSIGSFQ